MAFVGWILFQNHNLEALPLPPGYFWDQKAALNAETNALSLLVWPNYLVLESDIPEPGFKVEITQAEFKRRFPVWGIRSTDTGELVSFANAVLLAADLSQKSLSNEGWRFAIKSAFSQATPNCLCLLVANVHPKFRGLGFSQTLINRAKKATRELGLNTMIAPVRPTLKDLEPLLSMEEYISKKNSQGEIHDPWLRMHVNSGGEVTNICSDSVHIQATFKKWQEWTGLALDSYAASGEVILPKGLAPLKLDYQAKIGTYIEPNVWIRYVQLRA